MKLERFNKVGIILRPSTPELKEVFHTTKLLFEKFDIEVFIDNDSANAIDVKGRPFEQLCMTCDALVTIGGDGTIISAARRSYAYHIPILAIHAGKLGFLADLGFDELEEFIQKIIDGDYRINKRSMLEATIKTKDNEKRVIAFNDIVLTRPSISKMIHLDVSVSEQDFNTYYGDGLVVSTPTGSTAYNLSAGGPILYPLSEVFVLTPICPHSLTQRPLVLPAHFELKVKTSDARGLVIIDGQDTYEFHESDCIHIKLAAAYAHLIHKKEFNYFSVLKEKLDWGDL
ncbi:MAG: NAD(+)/NADH kinase [Campylobacterota bacterium]|nr:NAD(+)/NADH kinase [Campylobacterota bacterium]